jgi:hypothetical protein
MSLLLQLTSNTEFHQNPLNNFADGNNLSMYYTQTMHNKLVKCMDNTKHCLHLEQHSIC